MRLIDADELKRDFRQTFVDGERIDVREVIERIELLAPTVKPPFVKGRWMWLTREEAKVYARFSLQIGADNWVCSECGHYRSCETHVIRGFKFCPNCGARMDGANGT